MNLISETIDNVFCLKILYISNIKRLAACVGADESFLTYWQIRIWKCDFDNFEIKIWANRSRGLVHAFVFKNQYFIQEVNQLNFISKN